MKLDAFFTSRYNYIGKCLIRRNFSEQEEREIFKSFIAKNNHPNNVIDHLVLAIYCLDNDHFNYLCTEEFLESSNKLVSVVQGLIPNQDQEHPFQLLINKYKDAQKNSFKRKIQNL